MSISARRRPKARGPGRPRTGTPVLSPDDVLAAAAEEFREHGYAAARLKSIAERLGVSSGALYHYFPSKQEMFFAWLERLHESTLAVAVPDGASPTERIAGYVRRTTEIALQAVDDGRPRTSMSNQQLIAQLPADDRKRFRQLERRQIQGVRDIIDAGIASGEFECVNSTAAAFAVLAIVESVGAWYRPGGALSGEELPDLFARLALNMLGAG